MRRENREKLTITPYKYFCDSAMSRKYNNFHYVKEKNTKLAVQHINTSNSNFETKMCVYISPKQQIQNKPKMLKPPRYGLSLTISLN